MDVTGTLKVKGETTKVSEKFTKREFVITDNESQYPQHISFQLAQDKCSLLDKYNLGDVIKVHFNLRGREWTSPQGELKHFNTLEPWRLEGMDNGNKVSQDLGEIHHEETNLNAAPSDDSSDLPF